MSRILREFRSVSLPSLDNLFKVFSQLGKLTRVGGPERVYVVSAENRKAVAYAVGSGDAAIAFGWKSSPATIDVIYYWLYFDLNTAPDYAIDLPEGDISVMAPVILNMIKDQTTGSVEL